MPRRLRIAYFAHSIRSDWNNGNAHFLRGLLRSLGELGHDVTIFEPANGWSFTNLQGEPAGAESLQQFTLTYPTLRIVAYEMESHALQLRQEALRGTDIVLLHEWNPPELAHRLLSFRDALGFHLLFHDTHHRASSSPVQIRLLGIDRFDGVVAFGEALRRIYRESFGISRAWTLHEAADTDVFYPRASPDKTTDVVWIGNWGDGERSAEIHEFLLHPAADLFPTRFSVHGVRYPEDGLQALQQAHVGYKSYLPNLAAPSVYSQARITLHIPRQAYAGAMAGIPTIRVFEALACGIPLVSAPWHDTEHLFDEGDFCMVQNGAEMVAAIAELLCDDRAVYAQAERGLATVRARHTCFHRAQELTFICEEALQ